MANKIIIIKSDGTHTSPSMDQAQAQVYLGKLILANRVSNLKQSLNDVTGGHGKATGSYTFDGHPVLHASSGVIGVASLSLFFYESNNDHYIFAMGEHIKDTKTTNYKLSDYGQPSGVFKKNATISI